MKRIIALFLAAMSSAAALAQIDIEDVLRPREAAQREQISIQRDAAQAIFAVQEKQCYQRFAVNDCLNAARRERRSVLGDLRRQEISINQAQRQRRAAQQLLRADERAARAP